MGITRLHGRDEVRRIGPRTVRLYPIFHPAAALYTPSMLATLRQDFARLPELLALPAPEQPEPEEVEPVVPEPEAVEELVAAEEEPEAEPRGAARAVLEDREPGRAGLAAGDDVGDDRGDVVARAGLQRGVDEAVARIRRGRRSASRPASASWSSTSERPSEHSSRRSPARPARISVAGRRSGLPSSASMTSERDGWRRACSGVSCPLSTRYWTRLSSRVSCVSDAVAQQVGARVADVGQHVGAVVGHGDGGQRRAHPGGLRAAPGDEADRLVAPGDGVGQRGVQRLAEPAVVQVRERLDDPPARDLAGRVPADAVGHGGQPRAGVQRVLVVAAAADVAAGRALEREHGAQGTTPPWRPSPLPARPR